MTRLNIAFNSRQQCAIEWMAGELGVNKSEVLKRALALLEVALRERRNGNQLAVTRPASSPPACS